jgi:hypothetical protein
MPYLSLLGIALSCLLLVAYTSSHRSKRKHPIHEQAQFVPVPVPPAAARLKSLYIGLPRELRIKIAGGAPFGELPGEFRKALRDVILEANRDREDYAKAQLADGRIMQREYDEDRAYDQYVADHLQHYRISTTGDGFVTILFRTLLPGHELPKEDMKHGARGICRVQ